MNYYHTDENMKNISYEVMEFNICLVTVVILFSTSKIVSKTHHHIIIGTQLTAVALHLSLSCASL